MGYTIKQVAEKLDLTAYTLRYYEKECLLPFVERDERGNRVFGDKDVEWIILICCLRDTGMSVSEIKRYVEHCTVGDEKIEARRQILFEHKRKVEQKIEQMKQNLAKINRKLQYYDDFVTNNGLNCCCKEQTQLIQS